MQFPVEYSGLNNPRIIAKDNKESVIGAEQKECAVGNIQFGIIGLEMDVMAHLVEFQLTYVFSSHEVFLNTAI